MEFNKLLNYVEKNKDKHLAKTLYQNQLKITKKNQLAKPLISAANKNNK
ncbi:hypothetical protein [Lysinibacillus capsici]|nr:hypothetical protein [Lysinibacillus capsici]MEC1305430.1 hypothetical protein [Lysinibacillus capsici]